MTPQNAAFFHAAYAVAAVVYGVYIVSLLRRSHTVKEKLLKSRASGSRGSSVASRE